MTPVLTAGGFVGILSVSIETIFRNRSKFLSSLTSMAQPGRRACRGLRWSECSWVILFNEFVE